MVVPLPMPMMMLTMMTTTSVDKLLSELFPLCTVSPRTKSLTASSLAEFSERARGPDDGCQPASHVGTTEGTLSVPDRSKRYWMF